MRVTPSVLTAAVLASGFAASAFAQTPISVDRSGYQIFDASQISITAVALDQWFAGERDASNFYSSLGTDNTFGFSSQATGPNALIDDYSGDNSVGGAGLVELTEVSFVGGVGTVGHTIYFDFFSTGGALIGGFGVILGSDLNQVWTFDVTGQGIFSSRDGFMQIAGDDGSVNAGGVATSLRWFETNEAVDIGDNDAPTIFAYSLSGIPTPGAAALFGLAGLAATRRRR